MAEQRYAIEEVIHNCRETVDLTCVWLRCCVSVGRRESGLAG